MDTKLDFPTVVLFMLVIFPGLISINIYRLIMPARALDWGNALLQGLFYSTVNFVLALPILFAVVFGNDPLEHPVRYCIAAFLVLLVTPILWPIAIVAIFKSKRFARRIQIPYPTAWDFFFDRREPTFVLVHLNSGALLAGYWGPNSYAGTFPNDGDIYLEAVYVVDEAGKLGDPIPDTRGVLLQKPQYSYVELFSVPRAKEGKSGA
ncbi:MAG TPA: DUF6338 family protein [Longimicrobium sp.]|jgi:hypothetical protein|nr:DUF6338 family protein [Longimicrobium sp.]